MPDNWNKLADLLGTPSINPIERKSSPAKTPQKSNESTVVARVSLDSETEAPAELASDKQFASSTSVDEAPAITPEPEPKSIFKSTWDAVADLFGVAAPAKQEPEPGPATKPASSFWPSDERPGAEHRASQQVSDELLGRKSSSGVDSDLEALFSGFRSAPPTHQEQPQPLAREESRREPAPRGEFRGRNDRENRSGDRESRPPRRGRRDSVESDSTREPSEQPRRKTARVDMPPRESNVDEEIAADRRGPRRRPRRDVESDRATAEEAPRQEVEDTTIDRSRRGERSGSRNERGGRRGERSGSGSRERSRPNEDQRPARAPREEAPRSRTSAWDDPELQGNAAAGDNHFDSEPKRDRGGEGDESRRPRRRRRRPINDEPLTEDDSMASTGRQIYGRHADEDEGGLDSVESLSAEIVVPWIDAISGIIDKNMKNHRNGPSNSRGGRSGGPRGGNDRRR